MIGRASLAKLYPRDVEVWMPIPDRELEYEVSSLGAVKSLPRVITVAPTAINRRGLRRVPARVLRPIPHCRGYTHVSLGAGQKVLTHRLVLLAFVGPPSAGEEGLHENDIKRDNWIGNLSWGTPVANHQDALRNGKRAKGADGRWLKIEQSE